MIMRTENKMQGRTHERSPRGPRELGSIFDSAYSALLSLNTALLIRAAELRHTNARTISRVDLERKQSYPSCLNRNTDFIPGGLMYSLRVYKVSRDEFKYTTPANLSTIMPHGSTSAVWSIVVRGQGSGS